MRKSRCGKEYFRGEKWCEILYAVSIIGAYMEDNKVEGKKVKELNVAFKLFCARAENLWLLRCHLKSGKRIHEHYGTQGFCVFFLYWE